MTKPVIRGRQTGVDEGGGCYKICLEHTFQEVLEKSKNAIQTEEKSRVICFTFQDKIKGNQRQGLARPVGTLRAPAGKRKAAQVLKPRLGRR